MLQDAANIKNVNGFKKKLNKLMEELLAKIC